MARPSLMGRRAMDRECAAFNEAQPIGSKLWVYPGRLGGRLVETRIVQPGAYVLGGHTAVVQVADAGCVALTHVRTSPPEGL